MPIFLLRAMFNQAAAHFGVQLHWCAGTDLVQPLHADLIGKPVKAEYGDVNRVLFAGLGVLDEVTHAS